MSILGVKFAVVNADCSAFVYMDSGWVKESPVPKKSSIADSPEEAKKIIKRFYLSFDRRIADQEEMIKSLPELFLGEGNAEVRRNLEQEHREEIANLQKARTQVFNIVQIHTTSI